MSTSPEEVYYSQELLTDVFAAPIARLMQESAENYILEGKFKPLKSGIQVALQALWERAMYLGIADAEEDIKNPTKEQRISFSSSLSSFSDLIEFAKKKDPQIRAIDVRLKELNVYLKNASDRKDRDEVESIQREIDLAILQKEYLQNPGSRKATLLAQKIDLENKVKNTTEDLAYLAQVKQQLQEKRRELVELELPKEKSKGSKKKGTKVNVAEGQVSEEVEEKPEARPGKKRAITTSEQIRRVVTSGKRDVLKDKIANDLDLASVLSFDPKNTDKDPFRRILESGKKLTPAQEQINERVKAELASLDEERKRRKGRSPAFNLLVNETRSRLIPAPSQYVGPEEQARRKLVTTNQLQMYATLNERYPAIGRNSLFAEQYLAARQNTVATSLEKIYQEQIKNTIAEYIKTEGKVKESTVLKRIQQSYQSDKKERYSSLIRQLQDKESFLKETPEQYVERLRGEFDSIPKDSSPELNSLLERQKKLSIFEKKVEQKLERVIEGKTPQEIRKIQQQEDYKKDRERLQEAQRRLELIDDELQGKLSPKARAAQKKLINAELDLEQGTLKTPEFYSLTKEEKEQLIKLARYNNSDIYAKELPEIIKGRKEVNRKQLNSYIRDLKREGGRFDESLYQIASRTAATEVSAAYSIGRLQVYLDRGVKYVQWIATMDARTSVFCQSLHRKIFSIQELMASTMAKQTFPKTRLPEWHPTNQQILSSTGINIWLPPAHPYAYLPGTRVVSPGIELLMRKRYKGKSVTIKTEQGNTLSVTVEHPILTDKGFVRAGDLKGGEYIFDTFDSQGTIISNPDYQASIPTVENLFELSRISKSLVRGIVPVPTKDLDSNISNNKINIIGSTENLLQNIFVPQSRQDLIELLFERADVGLATESVNSIFNTIFLSPLALSPGIISRSYHLPSLFGSLPCIEDFLGTDVISDKLTTLSKNAFNNSSIYAKSLCDFFETQPSRISFYNNLSEFNRELPHSSLSEKMVVKRTQIVDIAVEEYDGFVYHVQDSSGINVANGIIAHNCRSFLSPIYTDDFEEKSKYPDGGFKPDKENLEKYLLSELANKEKLLLGMSPKQKERWFQQIVDAQQKMRQSKLSKLMGMIGDLQDTFNMGLSFLTRKLKQDKVAEFTVDEIKKNDSKLVAALLGGMAVVGTGAMMYFFAKSNLGKALEQYLKTSVGSLAFGSLTADAIKKLLSNLVKTSKELDKLPDSIKELLPAPEIASDLGAIDKINSINSLGEIAYEMAALGNTEDLNNLISSGRVQGVSPQAPKAIATRALYNKAIQKRNELTSRINTIMSNAMRNSGGNIQPSDIVRIEEWANVYAVVVRGKGNTFVSKAIFDEMMENPAVRSEIDNLQEEIEKFSAATEALEAYDGGDIIDDAISTANRLEYLRLKGNLRALRERVLNRDVIQPRVELPQNLPEVNDLLGQAVRIEEQYNNALETLVDEFRSLLPPKNLITGFIPESINSVDELKAVQKVIKERLTDISTDFLDTKKKGKPFYQPLTSARKRNLDSEFSEVLLDLEGIQRRLEANGVSYNTSISNFNEAYLQTISSELEVVRDLDNRISNRIKELTR